MPTARQVNRRDDRVTRSWLRVVRQVSREEEQAALGALAGTGDLQDALDAAARQITTERWEVALDRLWLDVALPLIWDDTVAEFGVEVEADPRELVAAVLLPHRDRKAEAIAERIRDSIRAARPTEKADDPLSRRLLRRVFRLFRSTDAGRVAAVEALQATAAVQHTAASAAVKVLQTVRVGIEETHIWNSQGDEQVRDWHREDGQERRVDEPFDIGGEQLIQPRDPSGSPGNILRCRCFETYGTRRVPRTR